MGVDTPARSADTDVRRFHVDIAEEAVADLRRRIAAWRPPEQEPVADQSQGVQLATVQRLADYWATEYDWRRCEATLNALDQFVTTGLARPIPRTAGQPPSYPSSPLSRRWRH